MNEIQLRLLEKNLTRSAKKAKKYWVRGMVGFTEADQGFFPLESIPVHNPIQNKETTLAELIEDCGNLNTRYIELQKDLDEFKSLQEKKYQELLDRINKIASVTIDAVEVL